jgi:hypothetical protein
MKIVMALLLVLSACAQAYTPAETSQIQEKDTGPTMRLDQPWGMRF